jgi:hypothetical protein
MARLYNYKASRKLMAGNSAERDLTVAMRRVPVFILERCGIKDIEEDYPIFKEAVSKNPLLF